MPQPVPLNIASWLDQLPLYESTTVRGLNSSVGQIDESPITAEWTVTSDVGAQRQIPPIALWNLCPVVYQKYSQQLNDKMLILSKFGDKLEMIVSPMEWSFRDETSSMLNSPYRLDSIDSHERLKTSLSLHIGETHLFCANARNKPHKNPCNLHITTTPTHSAPRENHYNSLFDKYMEDECKLEQ